MGRRSRTIGNSAATDTSQIHLEAHVAATASYRPSTSVPSLALLTSALLGHIRSITSTSKGKPNVPHTSPPLHLRRLLSVSPQGHILLIHDVTHHLLDGFHRVPRMSGLRGEYGPHEGGNRGGIQPLTRRENNTIKTINSTATRRVQSSLTAPVIPLMSVKPLRCRAFGRSAVTKQVRDGGCTAIPCAPGRQIFRAAGGPEGTAGTACPRSAHSRKAPAEPCRGVARPDRASRKAVCQAQTRPLPYPLAPEQIAASDDARRLVWDDELRTDWQCASTGFTDNRLIADLRDAIAGKRDDPRLQWLIGEQVERFRASGSLAHNLVPMRGAASRAPSVSWSGTPFPAWQGATRATSPASLITP